MADIVREKILIDVEAALNEISTTNGYRTDVKSVQRWDMHGNSLNAVPCLIISAGEDNWDADSFPLITAQFAVFIEAYIRQAENDAVPPDKILNKLLGDIYQALTVDETRGGNAERTDIKNITPFETATGQPHAGLVIRAEILYTFKQSDPETPR